MTPHELAHKLENIYSSNLEAVVLYGSALGKDYSDQFSNFNILVVLKDDSPTELGKAGKLIRKWARKGNPPPLFFTIKQIHQSLDVFPIEFLDIQDRHEVLIGKNPLDDKTIDKQHLRHQCESEIRGKLFQLRSFFTQYCHRPRRIAFAMVKNLPAFIATFRGILHLFDEKPAMGGREVIEQLTRKIDFDPQPFFDTLSIREGSASLPRGDEALAAFERYLTELNTITTFIDTLHLERRSAL